MSDNITSASGPASEVQDALLSLVRQTLRNQAITPEDDFFLAGGHSLLGTQLVIQVRKSFGVKVTLHDLFEAGTVAQLATRVEELIFEEIESLSDVSLGGASKNDEEATYASA